MIQNLGYTLNLKQLLMDVEKIRKYIDEHRKSMGFWKRLKQDIRVRYLSYKYKFEDWYRN